MKRIRDAVVVLVVVSSGAALAQPSAPPTPLHGASPPGAHSATATTPVLVIDAADQPRAIPNLLLRPAWLYNDAQVRVSFTLTNGSPKKLDGRVAARTTYPLPLGVFAVTNLAPGASVHGSLSVGPFGEGIQNVRLDYEEQNGSVRVPSGPGSLTAAPMWTSKSGDTVRLELHPVLRYVPRAPFDLVAEEVDDNGFKRNPRWAKQDKYLFDHPGATELWVADARPHIMHDCLDFAERLNTGNIVEQSTNVFNALANQNDDYNAFANGYCKHSPGVVRGDRSPLYCGNDTFAASPSQSASGHELYCASWSWRDNAHVPTCGLADDTTSVGESGGYVLPFHLSGHINFEVATYDGVARFDNAQHLDDWDSDWCTDVFTPHGFGVSGRTDGKEPPPDSKTGKRPNEPWMHSEWNPLNIGQEFDFGWWKTLRDAIVLHQVAPTWRAKAKKIPLMDKIHIGDEDWHWARTKRLQDEYVGKLLNGRHVIVTGLVGLDVGHNEAGAEIHPVLGMAVHTNGKALDGTKCQWIDYSDADWPDAAYPKSGPLAIPTWCKTDVDAYLHPERDPLYDTVLEPANDTWAMFATGWGNEGFCSTGELHTLDQGASIIGNPSFNRFTVRIPWAKDQTGADMADAVIQDATDFRIHAPAKGKLPPVLEAMVEAQAPLLKYEAFVDRRNRSIVVSFPLLPSKLQTYWFGELHVSWKRATAVPSMAIVRVPGPSVHVVPSTPVPLSHAPAEKKEGIETLTSKMTPAQRRLLATALGQMPPPAPYVSAPRRTFHATRAETGVVVQAPPAGRPASRGPRTTPDLAMMRALCTAYGGRVPQLPPDACSRVPSR